MNENSRTFLRSHVRKPVNPLIRVLEGTRVL